MILVIGGGFGGLSVVKALEKKGQEVTLIDDSKYFEFTPGIIRVVANPNSLEKLRVYHKSHLNSRFIQGKVKKITKDFVFIKEKKVRYDQLVIATGSVPKPINMKAKNTLRGESFKSNHKEFLDSKNVLIIGGGYVGVELAGEIATNFPSKKIIIIHSKNRLMHTLNQKASRYAREFLEKKGVKIIYNKRVVSHMSNYYVTDDDRKIFADFAFNCTGMTPNSGAFEGFLKLDKKGFVKVTESFLAKGFDNVYAIGDVCSIKEEKTAQNAEKHAKVVIRNLLGKKTKYKPKKRIMIISLGGGDGILTYKNFTLTGKITALLKKFVEWKTLKKIK